MRKVTLLTCLVITCVVADNVVNQLGRQLMLQQLQGEEKARTDGDSGVKSIRLRDQGTKSYHSTTFSRGSVFAIHDHSNNINTVGMGELEVVLNGVQFRTRHNDYKMVQKSKTSPDYNAVESLDYPDVPQEVLSLGTPEEQIDEMALWVKAWGDQDYSVRDYRPYFPANLCYLEGAWTHSSASIEESFDSDRHFLDAETWFMMQENIRFTAYTGSKDALENFSYLPTKIFDMINGSIPLFAQWNYRILCHKIKDDLPFNRMRIVEDLTTMMARKWNKDKLASGRGARFTVNTHDSNLFIDGKKNYGLLDKIMYEIPGKDNYQANLTETYGANTFVYNTMTPLNPGYYHRWYTTANADASGRSSRHRAFNDANLFFAMTTQDKIAGMSTTKCSGWGSSRTCADITQKWSYAIPLEIIYTTPLHKWNPYNIVYRGNDCATINANGRTGNGGVNDTATALNGTCNRHHYMTPAALYTSSANSNEDVADTVKGSVRVLDSEGEVRTTKASGVRIFINGIRGVEKMIRIRYPIAPIYAEGNTIWKELEALKDIVLNSQTNEFMFNEKLAIPDTPATPSPIPSFMLQTGPGLHGHVHLVSLGTADLTKLLEGTSVYVVTEERVGHTHSLKLKWMDSLHAFEILLCDNASSCFDEHDNFLHELSATT